jgi:PAS domain S-box-containing protein
MTKLLANYLLSSHQFEDHEELLKFQFQFFNTMLALAITISPLIAFIHRSIGFGFLFYSDLLFALTSFLLMLTLRKDKALFDFASTLFVPSLFVTITLVFFLAGDDPTKVIWAPIFFACAFLLRGSIEGFFWLFAILSSYLLGYIILSPEALYYSPEELGLIALAFITVSTIFNAFRQKNDADNTNLLEVNSSLQIKRDELETLNENLEDRIEQALIESQHKTKSIQRHLDIINRHVITAHIDLNGLISNISQAYSTLSGYGKQHFISQPFTLLFGNQTPMEELKTIWEELKNEQEFKGEIKALNVHNQSYWLDMHIQPEYTVTDEHIGFVCIAHNITDKKLVLQQQEQLIAQSRHAAMGEMISMIAHQWRQPLSTISAITSSMQLDISLENHTSEKDLSQIDKINMQVQHLSHTIDDFRDFFKPTKGLENTYVSKLVEEAVRLLDHRLENHVNVIYQQKIDICLALYHNELVQVLINILNNACDALIENHTKEPSITIHEYIQEDNVIIEISDNAGGIEKETLKHVFDPYFSTKTKNGTGLGLYMSKTIVEDHQKGQLQAFNVEDGAMFRITLPLSICVL